MRPCVTLALCAAAPFTLLLIPDSGRAVTLEEATASSKKISTRVHNSEIITTDVSNLGVILDGSQLDGSQQKIGILIDGKDVDAWVQERKADADADARPGSVRIGVVENPGGEQHNVVRHTRVRDSLILPPPAQGDTASMNQIP